MARLRIATFNLENFGDLPNQKPPLAANRIPVLQPLLERADADVLCLQEVHAQGASPGPYTLSDLNNLLTGTRYATFHRCNTVTQTTGSCYQQRNLVVASRFPITGNKCHYDSNSSQPQYQTVTAKPPGVIEKITWERPTFHVTIDVGGGRILNVIVLHLKSKIPHKIAGQLVANSYGKEVLWLSAAACAEGHFISAMQRMAHACNVRMLIDSIFDATGQPPLIAVCGDFNSGVDDVPLVAIRGRTEETSNDKLLPRVMVPCELSVPEPARYSLLHQGKGEMLDHIVVSQALMQYYKGTQIFNEVLPDKSIAFRYGDLYPQSDHAPVVAEFTLP